MGQVWQATDTQLGRQVALKILPDAFAADPDLLARFQREAQVLASLNHPNIAAIYGIEEAEGTRALVLELVEGPTLADRISKGPIPLDEALPIAKQIAEALEAAHEAGVIHRDLKPANIKVREDGTVKVLDFGLAKALDPHPDADPSQSPTLTAAATQMGVIMGTAAYMSPEQAKGKTADRRSDVWAFGAVLYEMLSGRRAFRGEAVSDTLVSVFRDDPDWAALPRDLPAGVGQAVRVCLRKDPKQRVRDIGAIRLAMDGVFEPAGGVPTELVADASRRVWQRPFPAIVGTLAIAGVATLAVWGVMRPDAPTPRVLVRFTIHEAATEPLQIASRHTDVAIAPDGHRVAYLAGVGSDLYGTKQLLLRSLGDFSPTTLAAGSLYNPFFSPDGEWVSFYDLQARELRRVSVIGGSSLAICDLDSGLRGASWDEDDTIVFATTSGLWRVDATGGVPEPLATAKLAESAQGYRWPQILPGGHAVLFTVVTDPIDDSQLAVLSLDTGEQKVVVRSGFHGRYAATGHLVYGVEDSVRAVLFDLDRLEVDGAPISVVEGVVTKESGAADFSLSDNGSLVYVPGGRLQPQARTLVWVDRNGREETLRAPQAPYQSPRISPDGRYIAVGVNVPENRDVIVYDLDRDTPMRLTLDPGADAWPIWTRDGRRVVFASNREGTFDVFSKAADGTGQADRVTTSEAPFQWPESWSSDVRTLVVGRNPGPGVRLDIHVITLGDGTRTEPLIQTEFLEVNSQVSPDGRWIAYQSNRSGQYEVYVRTFPDVETRRWRISRDGGQSPVWRADGGELFYRKGGSWEMMAVSVEADATFSPGTPEVLFAAPYLTTEGLPQRNKPLAGPVAYSSEVEAATQRCVQICAGPAKPWRAFFETWLSLINVWRGHWEDALALLEERRGHLPRTGRPNTSGAWTMLFGVVVGLAVLNEREAAAELYPLALQATETGVLVSWMPCFLLQTVAGIAAAAGGQWELAETHYQTALRQAHEVPFRSEQPEVRRWYAQMLHVRDAPGDRDKARTLLGEAVEMYEAIGMPRHVEMAKEHLKGAH